MSLNNLDIDKLIKEDGKIEKESFLLSYFNLITENLKDNNKKITRNSFWLVTSFLFYALLKEHDPSLKNISIQFVTIENNQLLLNLIPVFFSFVFFQNVTLWNNNINLLNIFNVLSSKIYSLATLSDTKNIIKPFSILHHVINYQYVNKNVPKIFKLPITIIFFVLIFFPFIFQGYAIYNIAINNTPTFIPITSAILIGVFLIATIVQALNSSKD